MKLHWKQAVPIFLLGLLVGAAAGSWGHRALFRRMWRGGPPGPERMVRRLSRELSLDPAQQESLRGILKAEHERMRAFHEETAARFSERRAALEAEIKRILTPAQQAKFDELSARWRKREARHGGMRRPHDGKP